MVKSVLWRFRLSVNISLVIVLLVVAAGAIVRATGSGMGCPDWPLCYGCLIPPVSESQLPADYATQYAVLGQPAEFNAAQTWIEYINRLLGALSGLAVLVTWVFSLIHFRRDKRFAALAFVALVLLAFVAWLGAKVVDTFLAPYAVTLHLAGAWALVAVLLTLRERILKADGLPREAVPAAVGPALAVAGLALLVQGWLGVQVREFNELGWLHELPAFSLFSNSADADLAHRVSAAFLGAATLVLVVLGWRSRAAAPRSWRRSVALGAFVALQAALGLAMAALHPENAFLKPAHLLLATGAFASWLLVAFNRGNRIW